MTKQYKVLKRSNMWLRKEVEETLNRYPKKDGKLYLSLSDHPVVLEYLQQW